MRKLQLIGGGGQYSDPIELLEEFMADIAHSLMIKYGLPSNPSQAQIDLWLVRVQANIAAGMGKEAAGESAARATFIGFRTRVYASQADTLEMLLAEAGRKK